MKPLEFKEATRRLTAPQGHVPDEKIGEISTLPVFCDGRQCVSLWRPSWKERLSILVFGRVWLALLSGRTQPPAYVQGSRRYFEEKP